MKGAVTGAAIFATGTVLGIFIGASIMSSSSTTVNNVNGKRR